ncbi:MAG: type II toxin-antitoxin system RelE/ParE family toxin [Deferribacterales bacterium]
MPFDIIWTKRAEADLDSTYDYIAVDDKLKADSVARQIIAAVESLREMPGRARYVPELLRKNIATYRELLVSVWRVIIYIGDDKVYVLGIIDGRRNAEDILFNRLVL